MRNRYATHWQRFRLFVRPSASTGYRDFVAWVMVGEGLIRLIDGALFPTPVMEVLPSRIWGLFELLLGIALFATRGRARRAGLSGQVAASLACGFCVAMAFALYQASVPSAFVHGSIAVILALEAQVSECR
jgi:hypothetical protein